MTAHLTHLASPPPLSASEAALAEVREAEAAEAKRRALDPEEEKRRKKAVEGLGGKFNWGDGVGDALKKCGERSDDGWIVCLVSGSLRSDELTMIQEIPAASPGAVALLKSESCVPSALASKLPEKSPCYTFYSYPTPPSAPVSTPAAKTPGETRNTFTATQGGARPVASSWPSQIESQQKDPDASLEGEKADAQTSDLVDPEKQEAAPASHETPETAKNMETPQAPASGGKPRVIFIYTCPSGSPIKFRMVYSSGVRGIQQDAMDKAGIEIATKVSDEFLDQANKIARDF